MVRAGASGLLLLQLVGQLLLAHGSAGTTGGAPEPEVHHHRGGGLTSDVMASIISRLPPVTPPTSGVRDGDELMRTVRLSGAYLADVPIVLPSYTRLVLDGTMDALPYKLGWTNASAGPVQNTAAMVSAKNVVMVSVEGGVWSCAKWNSSATTTNTTTVAAIYFDSTSYSFIRNLKISSCGQYSGGNNSGTFGATTDKYYKSGNIRVVGGASNVIENVESSHSMSRGLWAQTSQLVVSGGSYHHINGDGIDLDSGSSHNTIHNVSAYMCGRMGIYMEFTASYNTIVGCKLWGNHFANSGFGSGPRKITRQHNVMLANVYGPSSYPAGCPVAERPCPSWFPVDDPCVQVVGLPCGSNGYVDAKNYRAHGFLDSFSSGDIAVLNDLGNSSSGFGGDVENALVALNYNGTIDNNGVGNNSSNSVFAWNPDGRHH